MCPVKSCMLESSLGAEDKGTWEEGGCRRNFMGMVDVIWRAVPKETPAETGSEARVTVQVFVKHSRLILGFSK